MNPTTLLKTLIVLVIVGLNVFSTFAQEHDAESDIEADSSEIVPGLPIQVPASKKPTETFAQPWQLETAGQYSLVTNGRAPWKHIYANLSYRFTRRMVVYGEAGWQERFQKNDVNLKAGAYIPLAERWYAIAEANLSPSAQTIPRLTLVGQVYWEAVKAFFLFGGVRYGLFQDVNLTVATFGTTYYVGDFRLAARMSIGTTSLNETAWSVNGQASYYLANASSFTVGLAVGRELAAIDENKFQVFDVYAASFSGRQWITPRLGIVYGVLWQHQGTAFDVFGGRGGVCVRF